MKPKHIRLLFLAAMIFSSAFGAEKTIVRVGHFPNITHAQGVIGHQLSRQHKGWFEKRLGPDVEVQWFVYNSGPSAMEAIFTGSIDITYVGPGPTINAYVKSKGKEMRIICGSCSGGAALLVQPDGQITRAADFKGKRIGTPGFGNTQDIATRAWLQSKGLRITATGGDALVIPTSPPDQLPLFKAKQLDAVWTVEPWVSILELGADVKVFFEESTLWPETNGKYVTTHLVSSAKFLQVHPGLAAKWVLGQVELTEWIKENPDAAKELFVREIKDETKMTLASNVLDKAWEHVDFTYDPIPLSLRRYANEAYKIGFLKQQPDLKHIYELRFLNEALVGKKKAPVHE